MAKKKPEARRVTAFVADPLHVASGEGVLRSLVRHPMFDGGAQHRHHVLDSFGDQIAHIEAFANEAFDVHVRDQRQ